MDPSAYPADGLADCSILDDHFNTLDFNALGVLTSSTLIRLGWGQGPSGVITARAA